jgi:hypothetical protein
VSPLEAAIRAVCAELGASPDTWEGFKEIGRVAASAFVAALPAEIGDEVRKILEGS